MIGVGARGRERAEHDEALGPEPERPEEIGRLVSSYTSSASRGRTASASGRTGIELRGAGGATGWRGGAGWKAGAGRRGATGSSGAETRGGSGARTGCRSSGSGSSSGDSSGASSGLDSERRRRATRPPHPATRPPHPATRPPHPATRPPHAAERLSPRLVHAAESLSPRLGPRSMASSGLGSERLGKLDSAGRGERLDRRSTSGVSDARVRLRKTPSGASSVSSGPCGWSWRASSSGSPSSHAERKPRSSSSGLRRIGDSPGSDASAVPADVVSSASTCRLCRAAAAGSRTGSSLNTWFEVKGAGSWAGAGSLTGEGSSKVKGAGSPKAGSPKPSWLPKVGGLFETGSR